MIGGEINILSLLTNPFKSKWQFNVLSHFG